MLGWPFSKRVEHAGHRTTGKDHFLYGRSAFEQLLQVTGVKPFVVFLQTAARDFRPCTLDGIEKREPKWPSFQLVLGE